MCHAVRLWVVTLASRVRPVQCEMWPCLKSPLEVLFTPRHFRISKFPDLFLHFLLLFVLKKNRKKRKEREVREIEDCDPNQINTPPRHHT